MRYLQPAPIAIHLGESRAGMKQWSDVWQSATRRRGGKKEREEKRRRVPSSDDLRRSQVSVRVANCASSQALTRDRRPPKTSMDAAAWPCDAWCPTRACGADPSTLTENHSLFRATASSRTGDASVWGRGEGREAKRERGQARERSSEREGGGR